MALRDDETGWGVSLDSVLAELARGTTVSCYLLSGDEEFRLQDALERITTALLPRAEDRDLCLFSMDGDAEDIDALCESLITAPLLPGRKVVVVRDTRLFQSKNVLPSLIERIRERLERDPQRATADFLHFLQISGLRLEDLRGGGWRKIDDETWRRIVPDEGGEGREAWLPTAVEIAVSRGAGEVKERPEETDRLERTLTGGMPEGNHLILTAEAVDRRKKLFKTISSVGRVLSFTKVKGEARQQQVMREMAGELLSRHGKRLSAGAWSILGQKTGFDLRESLGAIEKLITYAGEKAQIEAADVEAVIGRTKEENIFALTSALAGRNLTAALGTLHDLLDQGEPALRVFSMIVREIRHLFQAKLLIASGRVGSFSPGTEYGRFQKTVYPAVRALAGEGNEAIALVSQHPFVVYQALANAGRFSREELAGYVELLVQTDLALKTTGRDQRFLLERVVLRICQSR